MQAPFLEQVASDASRKQHVRLVTWILQTLAPRLGSWFVAEAGVEPTSEFLEWVCGFATVSIRTRRGGRPIGLCCNRRPQTSITTRSRRGCWPVMERFFRRVRFDGYHGAVSPFAHLRAARVAGRARPRSRYRPSCPGGNRARESWFHSCSARALSSGQTRRWRPRSLCSPGWTGRSRLRGIPLISGPCFPGSSTPAPIPHPQTTQSP
jgi:hypothetical protein